MLDSRHPARTVPAVTSSVKITQLLAGVFMEERELTVGGIVDAIEDRGFGFLLLVLALPTLVPILPPGSATVVGFLYVPLALQMRSGAQRPWLPKRIRASRVSSTHRPEIA
jgi:hypothetical protein